MFHRKDNKTHQGTEKYIYLIEPKRQKWLSNLEVSKNLMKYCIIKASLRVENRTQYTNRQMNNAVKNKIYLKEPQYMKLD